jgi:hypothetical protein
MDEVLELWTPLDPDQVRERIQSRAVVRLPPLWSQRPGLRPTWRDLAPYGARVRARFPDGEQIDLEVLVPFRRRAVVSVVRITVAASPAPERSGSVLTCRLLTPPARAAVRRLLGTAMIVVGVVVGAASAFDQAVAAGYRVLSLLFATAVTSVGVLAFSRPKLSDQKPVLRWLATNVEAVVPEEPPLLPWFT